MFSFILTSFQKNSVPPDVGDTIPIEYKLLEIRKTKIKILDHMQKILCCHKLKQNTTRKPGGFMQSCVFPCIVKFLVHLLQYLKDTTNIIPQTSTKYVVLYENWVTQI